MGQKRNLYKESLSHMINQSILISPIVIAAWALPYKGMIV